MLDFGAIGPAKGSVVRELDEASNAFNQMIAGLRWFETYLPKTLVLRLMERGGQEEIQSEERMVTVMFTDIWGFTAISEQKSASETAQLLNEHFTLINQAVEAEDGTIDKYMGDSVMTFWGAPLTQTDHAVRACRAAVAIGTALEAHNEQRRANKEDPIRTRIGLHSGPAIAGNIGSPGAHQLHPDRGYRKRRQPAGGALQGGRFRIGRLHPRKQSDRRSCRRGVYPSRRSDNTKSGAGKRA